MTTFILKSLGIIGASWIAYILAKSKNDITHDTHPFLAVFLELGALAIVFFS